MTTFKLVAKPGATKKVKTPTEIDRVRHALGIWSNSMFPSAVRVLARLAKKYGVRLLVDGKPYTKEMGRQLVDPENERRIVEKIRKMLPSLQKRAEKRKRRPQWVVERTDEAIRNVQAVIGLVAGLGK